MRTSNSSSSSAAGWESPARWTTDVDRLAAQAGDGLEAAARKARYRFLEQAAGRMGARFVATAHTADDQAETILHRIVRGTGVRGLAGMARVGPAGTCHADPTLLGIRRDELRAYLDALGQPYRHDPSNADRRFTRNRIRHGLLPAIAGRRTIRRSSRPCCGWARWPVSPVAVDGLVDELVRHAA